MSKSIKDEARKAVARARSARPMADWLRDQLPTEMGGGHVDRVELVKRFVAGVSHELEKMATRESFARIEGELSAPGDALSSAASAYVQGGELGNFLLALDAYSAELRRICEGLDVRSFNE